MSYNHGVTISEQATSLVSAVSCESALPIVFGTAPINMTDLANVNKPVLCYSYADAVAAFGYVDDFSAGYSLPEVIYSQFSVYAVSPTIFVNVLDPEKHIQEDTITANFVAGKLEIMELGIIPSSVSIEFQAMDMEQGLDYELSFTDTGTLQIETLSGSRIQDNIEVEIIYTALDPSMVTADDIIGGIDIDTGAKKGLELINEVFPRFRVVPALVAAPGYSHLGSVATIMASKASVINGMFQAVVIADIVSDEVLNYTHVAGYKNDNSIIANNLVTCWPKVCQGDKEFYLSTHMLGVMAKTDSSFDSVPYKSPSNESLIIDGLVNNGNEVILTPDEAAYLNSQGIITALNFIGGFVVWGNRTSIYPANTDVKDCMLPVRRMFAWVANTIILTYWQKVDYPIRKRTIDNIVDSVTYWLNGLTAREIIIGGRIEFQDSQNPTTDIMDGIIRFNLYFTPPTPAREIHFSLEYDPTYLETLFS